MSFCGEIFEHSRDCSTYLPLFKVTPTRDSLVSGVSLGVRDIVQLNIIYIHVRVELKSSNISTCFVTGIQSLLEEYLRFEASRLYVRILHQAVNFFMLCKLFNSLHKGRISRPYIVTIHLRHHVNFRFQSIIIIDQHLIPSVDSHAYCAKESRSAASWDKLRSFRQFTDPHDVHQVPQFLLLNSSLAWIILL